LFDVLRHCFGCKKQSNRDRDTERNVFANKRAAEELGKLSVSVEPFQF
jgi:hypothetical protein